MIYDDDDEIDDNTNSIIVKNNDIIMQKINKNHYKIEYSIENNATYLKKLLDFNIIKLVYDINKEFFEEVKLEIIDENSAKIFILMKHLFQDFGMPQRYSCLYLNRAIINDSTIVFTGTPDITSINNNTRNMTEPLPIENIKVFCTAETEHKINFKQEILYDNEFNIPKFMEKMAGIIITKMFLRAKQFIENLNK